MHLLVSLADCRQAAEESAKTAFLVLGELGCIENDGLGARGEGHEAVPLAPAAKHFPIVLIRPPGGLGTRGAEGALGLL